MIFNKKVILKMINHLSATCQRRAIVLEEGWNYTCSKTRQRSSNVDMDLLSDSLLATSNCAII